MCLLYIFDACYSQVRVPANFSPEMHEAAIEFYRQHPGLYDKKHRDYPDTRRKKLMKQELCDQIGCTPARLHTWYTTQRRELLALRKKMALTGGRGNLAYTQQLRLEQLDFMFPFVGKVNHSELRSVSFLNFV